MKIIFMGTPQFGAEVLKGLIENNYEVIAVVTQPDRPVGRKQILTPSPVKSLALEHQIPVYQPEKIGKSEELATLLSLESDLLVTAAYGQFVPTVLLEKPLHGAINVHASLLPKYRGGAPIHYALWQGEKETGISIIEMVKQMDAGDIFLQRSLPITKQDDVGTLFDKLAVLGRETLLEVIPMIEEGRVKRTPQNPDLVTFSPNIPKEFEQINWKQSAEAIDCHIRAFRPFPSTYTYLDGQRVKIWSGYPVDFDLNQENSSSPGTIVGANDESLIVAAGQGTYFAIVEWQESGKKRIAIKDYFNGTHPQDLIGQHFQFKE